MDGLSRGVFFTHGFCPDLRETFKEDYIITPASFYSVVNSMDLLVEKGRITEHSLFKGYLAGGDFYKWNHTYTDIIPTKIAVFVGRHLRGFSGVVNVEYSQDNQIFEMHLRPSLQAFAVDGGLIGRWAGYKKTIPCGWIKVLREPSILDKDLFPDAKSIVECDLEDDEVNARNRRLALISFAY